MGQLKKFFPSPFSVSSEVGLSRPCQLTQVQLPENGAAQHRAEVHLQTTTACALPAYAEDVP